MPKFHVQETFELPERNLFVMAGTVLEGEIQPGMFIHIPCNSSLDITARIDSVETALRQNSEEVCLCIKSEPDDPGLLSGFNIRNETIEVSTQGSD